jgi:general secretion pathway protein A
MIREEAKPLSQEELRNYVLFKLNMAGNTGKISIKKDAIKRIHKVTGGNFRQVNVLNMSEITRRIVSEAQRDLYPREPMSIKWRLAWGLSAILILCLAGGLFLPEIVFKIPWIETNTHLNLSVINNAIRDKGLLPQTGATVIRRKIPVLQGGEAFSSETQQDRRIPEAVSNFLASYGLSDFGGVFVEALEARRLRELADSIFDKTGYQMVELDRGPDKIRNHYGTLSLYAGQEGKEKYILFWRPKIKVTKFYLGYEGEEIRSLQKLLADGGLYKYKIDGIVGPQLIAAVNRLQDAGGLNVTGFPDEKTIFVLCQTAGDRHS